MRRIFAVLLCLVALSGCDASETFETVADAPVQNMYIPGQVEILLPRNAVSMSMESDTGEMFYQCDGYSLIIQTMAGGDLERTIRKLSGFQKDDLTVVSTDRNGMNCYECVWSAMGEEDSQICRALVLDDGNYHYAVTVMADYAIAGELSDDWNMILNSVEISID